MKVNELLSILDGLDPDMDVKLYLFTEISLCNGVPLSDGLTDNPKHFVPMSVNAFQLQDVLVSHVGNSVLLSSVDRYTHNI